jgi:hypothetical protein
MVASVKGFSRSKKNGLFINPCFAHCQSELPRTWNNPAGGSPAIQNKVQYIQYSRKFDFSDGFKRGCT